MLTETERANSRPIHRSKRREESPSRQKKSSRLPGFYELAISERVRIAQTFAGLSENERDALSNCGAMSPEMPDVFIENAVGSYSLPLGFATNFLIDDEDYLVPMAVEETSVLAAASHGAKLARAGGGFTTTSSDPIMTGQIQIFLSTELNVDSLLEQKKEYLISYANRGQDGLLARGGGAQDLDWHRIPEINALVLHLHVDTRDAMGANIVNTMCERVSQCLPELFPCEIGLRILTNLNDRRVCKASCLVPKEALHSREFEGKQVVDRIHKAYQFAYYDVYRATTHNKGIMNGVDPILIATGNDWRAVEAGAHAFACRKGVYRPLSNWWINSDGDLEGELELPMAVGVVGGVTKLHPTAQAALKILGRPNATRLGEIICSVGLAQNLSALRALASEGIQRGHMSLHSRNIEMAHRQGATRS